jgi:hypothetical protein
MQKLQEMTAETPKSLAVEILIGCTVTLCIVTLLLLHMPSAEIELYAEADEVRFALGHNTHLFHAAFPVSWIRIQGHDRISISPDGNGDPVTITGPEVVATVADSKGTPMSLDIPELSAHSEIQLSHRQDGTREIAFCDLEMSDRPVTLSILSPVKITGNSSITISPPVREKSISNTSRPRPVLMRIFRAPLDDKSSFRAPAHGCSGGVMLRLGFPSAKSEDPQFSRDLPIQDLELFEEAESGSQPLSTLVSGQLRIASTKATPTVLFPNDLLVMQSSSGRMRSLTMGDRTTKFDFQGTVKTLSIGSATMRRSAMPSMLEWWLSQERIFVAWSAGLSGIAFLMGVYQWILKRR